MGRILNKALYVSVRGPQSVAVLSKLGVKNVFEFKDPAINLFKDISGGNQKSKKIAVNFADIGDRIYGRNELSLKENCYNFIKELLLDNWDVNLYSTTGTDLNYMLNDLGLREFKSINIFKGYENINKSLDFLKNMDLLVGQRLHSIVFATCVGTPFFALAYEPKTFDFLESVKLEKYGVRVDDLDLSHSMKSIRYLYDNLNVVSEEIKIKLKEAYSQQSINFNRIKKIIDEN